MLIRVKNGTIKLKDKVRFMSTKAETQVEQLGVFTPKSVQNKNSKPVKWDFLITGVKELGQAKVGVYGDFGCQPPLSRCPVSKSTKPVFAGLYLWKATTTKRCATL